MSSSQPFNGWDMAALLTVPTLINAMNFPGGRSIGSAASLVVFCMLGILALRMLMLSAGSVSMSRSLSRHLGEMISAPSGLIIVTLLLCVAIAISMMRAAYFGYVSPFSWMVMVAQCLVSIAFGFMYFRMAAENNRLAIVCSLALGISIYVCINLVGHALGLQGAAKVDEVGLNKTLSMLGLQSSRVAFPFAAGVNGFAITAGLGMLMCIGAARNCQTGLARLGMLAAALPCVAAMVMIDSRAAFVMGVGTLILDRLYRSGRGGAALAHLTLAALVLLPYVATGVVRFVEEHHLLSFLQREDTMARSLGIASGRDYVWQAIVDRVITVQGVIGYGNMGQAISGASAQYAWIFSERGVSTHTAHNAALQYTIDTGVPGLLLWWSYWVLTFRRLRSNTTVANALAPGLIFILLMGLTETSGTPYAADSFQLMLLCTGILGAQPMLEAARRVKKKASGAGRMQRSIVQEPRIEAQTPLPVLGGLPEMARAPLVGRPLR